MSPRSLFSYFPDARALVFAVTVGLVPLTALANVDLVVNNTDSPDPVPATGVVTYTVRVTSDQTGNETATNVNTAHAVSIGATYEGFAGTGVACTGMTIGQAGPGTLNCSLPNLAVGQESVFTIRLKSSSIGNISLGATVTSNQTDIESSNDTLNESTTVDAGANVAVTATPSPGTAPSGSVVSLNLAVSNAGPSPATNLVVTTPVPTGLNVTSVPAGCVNSGSVVTCTIAGPIAPGGSLSLGNITGQITAAGSSTISSTSSIQVSGTAPPGTPQDPDVTDNTDVANITVTAGSDLRMTKARSVGGNLLVGQAFNFVLSPTYSGDSPSAISVTDTVPANYTIGTIAASQNGWACNVAGQVVTCTRASGGVAGLNQPLGVITIPVTAATAGSPTNSATISSSTIDPTPANNTGNDGGVTILAPTVNLGVNKTGPSPALVVKGVPFDYRITANNTGTTGYFGTMTVTDNLPAGLTVNSYTLNGWTCSPAAPVTGAANISCSRTYTSGAPLGVNETTPAAILNVTATIDGTINNNATITADCNLGAGNCGDGDTASYQIKSSINTDSADIRMLKSVTGPTTVAAGDVLTYRLEVVNAGPSVSQNVQLTDTFTTLINDNVGPTGAGYIGHVITNGAATCSTASVNSGTGRRLNCTFPNIPACTPGSDCPVITVEVRPGGNGGTRTNTANAVSLDTADPNHSNDEASANATIDPRADVTVTKNANPGTVAAGQPLTYLVTASNVANGLSAADAVTITDTLPLDVTFVSATPSSGSCSTMPAANSTTIGGNRTVTCNLGTVNNGSQRTVSIIVRPNNATRGTTITNNVSVATSTTEVDATNNTALANATVTVPSLDLVMNKVDTADPVAVGDTTAYTLTVSNSGPSAAENVIVKDPLPTTGQLTFQSAVVNGAGTCGTVPAMDAAGGLVSCSLGYLPAGTTRTITINMKGAAKGVYTNSAEVLSDESLGGFDTNASNNTDGETTTVRTKADMEVVSKVPSQTSVNLRDDFNFKITVHNNGPLNEADDVEVTDNLPAGMELTGVPSVNVVSGTTTLSTCTGSAGTTTQFKCSLGTVSLNAVIEITVPVQLVSLSGGTSTQTFTNQATVSTSSLDSVSGNNTKTGGVTVDSSTLSGRVFGDLENDGVFNGSDVGLAGVTVTLSGTSFDGVSVTRTATTDASGNYTFTGVPQGTYQVQEGTVTATHYVDGIDTAGSAGGNASVNDRISNINLPANTAATGYNFAEKPVPLIGIAKQAGAVVNNLDGTYDVPFTLTITNAGKTPLSSVQINDTVAGQFGTYAAGAPLAGQYTISSGPTVTTQTNGAAITAAAAGVFTGSGAGNALLLPASSALPNYGTSASSARVSFTVRFFPTTSGPFNNTATVTGLSPTNETVTDNSVNGAIPDANTNDDPTDDTSPTVVNLAGQVIGIAKSVGAVLQTGTKRFRIPYTLILQNISATVTATNVQVVDSLNSTFPTAQSISISSPATVSACTGTVLSVASPAFNGKTQTRLLAGNQNLQHGERCTITFTTEIDFGVNPLPAVVQNNQATATTSQTPGGTVIATDLSNDGVDIDPNSNGNAGDGGENVPTPVNFGPGTMSSVRGTVYLDRNHDRANNDGGSAPNVVGFIVEVLNSAGEIIGTATTAADGTYLVNGLRPSTPGDTSTYYTVRFREPASGLVYGVSQSNDPNPARNGVVKDGEITQLQLAQGATTINQDLPLDPSGVVYDSVSRNPVGGATVTITSGGTPVPGTCLVGGSNTQVTGATGMYQFLLINPIPPGCPGAGTYTLQVVQPAGYLPPPSGSIPPAAAAYTPTSGGVDAIQAQVGPPTGAQPTTYYFSFQLTPGVSSDVVNNHIPLDPILSGAIIVSKTTPLVNVVRSDLVPYTVIATNTLASTLPGIELVDNIPAGFRYKVGSATLDGVHVEPKVEGRKLTWLNQTFGPTAPTNRKTIRLLLVVGTGVSEGEYVNQALARNTVAAAQVSNLATATVRVVPDPTFDCSDIIGKVFDDKNANGYQDQDESGIPNVRVATARGLLVTTDHDGRFHVACADIPNADRGANFVMKLDERTLPSGYRVTTENPRDVRVTRGKMTKLNFGATVHRVIRLELSGAAFDGNGTQLQATYEAELEKLPAQLQERPSVLRIAYRRGAESADLAQKRIDAVSDRIRELWKENRKREEEDDKPLVPLMIETEMEAAQ